MTDDLLEISPFERDEGALIGKDPRKVDPAILARKFSAQNPLKALRARCLDCVCGQPLEIRKCTATDCPSWPFRMNSNPFRRKPQLSEEELQRRTDLLKAYRND